MLLRLWASAPLYRRKSLPQSPSLYASVCVCVCVCVMRVARCLRECVLSAVVDDTRPRCECHVVPCDGVLMCVMQGAGLEQQHAEWQHPVDTGQLDVSIVSSTVVLCG